MAASAILQYKEQSVQSMTDGERLILLFDEALKNLHFADLMLKEQNYPTAEKCTEKCKQIFNYLASVLDLNSPLSANLRQLYTFVNSEIIKAQIRRDPEPLGPVYDLVKEMRDTWQEADRLTQMERA